MRPYQPDKQRNLSVEPGLSISEVRGSAGASVSYSNAIVSFPEIYLAREQRNGILRLPRITLEGGIPKDNADILMLRIGPVVGAKQEAEAVAFFRRKVKVE